MEKTDQDPSDQATISVLSRRMWRSGRIVQLPPARWQELGKAKEDGAKSVHRSGKAQDRREEICSSEKSGGDVEGIGGKLGSYAKMLGLGPELRNSLWVTSTSARSPSTERTSPATEVTGVPRVSCDVRSPRGWT